MIVSRFLAVVFPVACVLVATPLVATPRDGARGATGKNRATGENGRLPFEEKKTEQSPAKVRCPRCDDSGKATCSQCQGEGELSEVCKRCSGKGRRPCPVCSREAKGEELVVAGRIACGLCGGTGTLGNAGKICSRCSGKSTLLCTTCLGKGTLSCRKRVPGKICPTCRFVGKAPCVTCGGTTLVAPGTVELSVKKKGKGGKETVAKATTFDPEMLGERYRNLTQVHESFVAAFKDDPRPELERLRREVILQSRSLYDAGLSDESGTADEVDTLLTRVTEYRTRWMSLSAAFEKHLREYRKAQSLWDARTAKMAKARAQGRAKRWGEKEANTLLDRALRISEKFSRLLSSEDANLLLAQLEEVRKAWPVLKNRAVAELAAVAESNRKTRGPVARRSSTGSTRTRPAWVSDSARAQRRASAVVPRAHARKAEPETRVTTAAKREADSKQLAGSKQTDPPPLPPSAAFQSLLWGLSGFAVASVLFWFATRPGSLPGLARRGNRE